MKTILNVQDAIQTIRTYANENDHEWWSGLMLHLMDAVESVLSHREQP